MAAIASVAGVLGLTVAVVFVAFPLLMVAALCACATLYGFWAYLTRTRFWVASLFSLGLVIAMMTTQGAGAIEVAGAVLLPLVFEWMVYSIQGVNLALQETRVRITARYIEIDGEPPVRIEGRELAVRDLGADLDVNGNVIPMRAHPRWEVEWVAARLRDVAVRSNSGEAVPDARAAVG